MPNSSRDLVISNSSRENVIFPLVKGVRGIFGYQKSELSA